MLMAQISVLIYSKTKIRKFIKNVANQIHLKQHKPHEIDHNLNANQIDTARH